MYVKLFEKGDGTNREFRPAQKIVIDRLRHIWYSDDKPVVILGQTGLGKSMLAKTIESQFNTTIVTPQNSLIKQYIDDYPDLNYWWGQPNFTCHKPGYHTSDCQYTKNKQAAILGKSTVFNPMSLYYLRKHNPEMQYSPVVVLDEAHVILKMLYNLSGIDIDVSEETRPQRLVNSIELVEWMTAKYEYAAHMWEVYESTGEDKKAQRWKARARRYEPILDGMEKEPEAYAIQYDPEKERIKVSCTWLPRHIVDRTFGPGRKVLLSGTVFRPDVLELLGTSKYHLIEPPAAIPKENRPIYYRPVPFAVNFKCDKKDLAQYINKTIDLYSNNERVIVHLPYSWSQEIAKYMSREVITHDSTNKAYALQKYKDTPGSILLACGMAEGIDLKGDLCRLNIIPKVLWPNLKDDFIQKKAGQGSTGSLWYGLEAAKTVIQQAGRSTRGPEDWSRTVVLDPSFVRLIQQFGSHMPKSFLEAIIWEMG